MNITIGSIEQEIVGSETRLIAVSFLSASSSSYYASKNWGYKITREGLFFNNPGIIKKRIDALSSDSTKKKLSIEKERYGYEPLRLVAEDLPFIKEITAHWEAIRDQFVYTRSEGNSWCGHVSTKYFFPDGTKKIWYSQKFRGKFPVDSDTESLEDFLEHKRGKPLDAHFPSAFCEYIEGVPFLQHYQHGRLDYFLERESISLQDNLTNQKIPNLYELLEVLAFYAAEPETAVKRLVFGE